MAAGVNATISLDIAVRQVGTAGLAAAPSVPLHIQKSMEFLAGTAAVGQSNVLYAAQRTLAASANEDIDLRGALTDALGASIAAAELVLVYIAAAAGNTNSVQVTRPASNGIPGPFLAAGDGLSLPPGDFFLVTNRGGIAVTAGTGDLINVANGGAGTPVTYDIVVLGRTVAA